MKHMMSGGRRFFWGRRIDRFRYIGAKAAGSMIFGMFLLLSALVVATGPKASPVERVEREWPVSYDIVTPTTLSPTLQVFGVLETDQQPTLRSGVTATVQHVLRREGDWVNAGDVIVQLETAEAELALQAAQASVRRAQAALASVRNEVDLAQKLAVHHQAQSRIALEKLQRFESLHQQRMIADAQLDEVRQEANERAMVLARHESTLQDYPNLLAQSQAAVEESLARLQQAELDVAHTQIRAPFNGRVIRLEVARGDRISAGASVVQVADFDRLQVRAPVPVNVAQRLRKSMDQAVPVTAVATVAGDRLGFKLQGLGGSVRAGQSGIDAFFRVEPDAAITLGSVVNLNLQLPAEPDVVPVPVHALYDNNRVYRIDDNRLQAVMVERVGEQLDDAGNFRVLVRSHELHHGDHLMVSQLPTAMTGLLVNPMPGSSALADSSNPSEAIAQQGGQWPPVL